MSKIQEHRIYKHLSEPLRIIGMTVDELVLAGGGFFGSLIGFEDQMNGTLGMLGAVLGVFILKKAKKNISGGFVKSFLQWQGFWSKPFSYPPFEHREYKA